MTTSKPSPDAASQARIAAARRQQAAVFQRSYRDRALALLPHVCAACAREFAGKRLRELTVHHKDGNYKHNPPDGSNWELLCVYCHDYEHERHDAADLGAALPDQTPPPPAVFSPFANLDTLLATADPPAPAAPPAAPTAVDPPPTPAARPDARPDAAG